VEEIDARASASSVQTAAEIRVYILPDKKLSEGTHRASPARASPASIASVLRSEVQHYISTLIKYLRSHSRIMIVIFNKLYSWISNSVPDLKE